MKKLILIALLLLPACGRGTTYYVDNTGGDDDNSGLSEVLAWEHVQKACTLLVAGDTVFIRAGTYDEQSLTWGPTFAPVNAGLRPTNSGTSGNEIVFKGYPGDALPIILGINSPDEQGGRGAADLYGLSYIVFDSLHFHNGWSGINLYDSHYITVKYCIIDSLMSSHNNAGGICCVNSPTASSVSNITVDHCDISWVGENGGWNPGQSSAIHLYSCSFMTFTNNTIHHVATGINFKGGNPHINCGDDPSDTASGQSEVAYNVFYNITNGGEGGVRLGGGGTFDSIIVHHNLFYNCEEWAITPSGAPNSDVQHYSMINAYIYNNTIIGGDTTGGIRSGSSSYPADNDSTRIFNNIFYNTEVNYDNRSGAIGAKSPYTGTECNEVHAYYEDYNMYYGSSNGDYFYWDGDGHVAYSLAEWKAATPAYGGALSGVLAGQGTHSVELDPEFLETTTYTIDTTSNAATGGRGGAWPSYFGYYDPGTVPPTPTPSSPPIKIKGAKLKGVKIK